MILTHSGKKGDPICHVCKTYEFFINESVRVSRSLGKNGKIPHVKRMIVMSYEYMRHHNEKHVHIDEIDEFRATVVSKLHEYSSVARDLIGEFCSQYLDLIEKDISWSPGNTIKNQGISRPASLKFSDL